MISIQVPINEVKTESCSETFLQNSLTRLLYSGKGINIEQALNIISTIDTVSFESVLAKICRDNNEMAKINLHYYLCLFRREHNVRSLLESPSLPAEYIECMLHYVSIRNRRYLHCGNAPIIEVIDIIPTQKLFDLILQSSLDDLDNTVLLHILSKMDNKQLDLYFQDGLRVKRYLSAICDIPETSLRSFFMNNPDLHGYCVMLRHSVDTNEINGSSKIYDADLNEIGKIRKIAINISERFNIKNELSLPMSKRDVERYAYIVKNISHLENISYVLKSLGSMEIINSEEESLVEEIICNPIFKDVRVIYSSRNFETKMSEMEFF